VKQYCLSHAFLSLAIQEVLEKLRIEYASFCGNLLKQMMEIVNIRLLNWRPDWNEA